MTRPEKRSAFRVFGLALVVSLATSMACAQGAATAPPASYTWIFTGLLPASGETFSGTLATGVVAAAFELRLAGGATCDGGDLEGEADVVTLHELTCSDGRRLRARFVAEGGTDLRVFGTLGDEEFIVDAHLIDFDAPADSAAGRTSWPPALPPVPRRPVALP